MQERYEKRAGLLLLLAIIFVAVFTKSYAEKKPTVVRTNPVNGATDVAPGDAEISVTFSEPMMDRSWSWAYDDIAQFPAVTGQPSYQEDRRTCVLPVHLEPNREYVVWINTGKLRNFRGEDGTPAVPYRVVFRTLGNGDSAR